MEKAKVMLSATGIISIIAGALAFKAQHKFSGQFYCTATFTTVTSKKFNTKYTTVRPLVTLFCTLVPSATASVTTLVGPDI